MWGNITIALYVLTARYNGNESLNIGFFRGVYVFIGTQDLLKGLIEIESIMYKNINM